ncbi:hypothetical protein SAMN02746041_03254 [Desulfacinum hydrothermale DSM 13146]|uniref:Uncharacterized protein n=1 Tax=Desulfacinum hydrothermale DSM 13146 TaxID=1121390 RepID=A0A1W1XWV8_9BACT|nr:hypothetical protein [Desulfacinum hydrothermale]SMC28423.1 hypothetical protein SAMN02746041_03254 [Desulfacinum hydrothermale DSM 13146]
MSSMELMEMLVEAAVQVLRERNEEIPPLLDELRESLEWDQEQEEYDLFFEDWAYAN